MTRRHLRETSSLHHRCGWHICTQDAGSLSCDEPDPVLLQTSSFSTGFADGHYEYASTASSAFVTVATLIW